MIHIVIGDDKNGPMNPKCSVNPFSGKERWREPGYEVIHIKQIIILDYTKEIYEEIKEASGREIIDRRTRRGRARKIDI